MQQSVKVMECIWNAGIYARLSVDNHNRKNESIDTQIDVAKEYIRKSENIVLAECYTDLGKTGTNFEREGFERMMVDIRRHKINCVIVKDFSRFGRNYIETGNYMEKIFPFFNVRFISVSDGYDSHRAQGENDVLAGWVVFRDTSLGHGMLTDQKRTSQRLSGGISGTLLSGRASPLQGIGPSEGGIFVPAEKRRRLPLYCRHRHPRPGA